mgnify:FL=1
MLATTTNFETGEEETSGYLRYDEFVALNTWQVQKAKARISEVEERVAELKAAISKLQEG